MFGLMFTCRLEQKRILAAFDEGRQLSVSTRTHLRNCQRCQQFHAQQKELQELIQEKPLEQALPANFSTRLLNQLHAEGSLKSPKRAPSLPLAWGVSLALAAFMIGLILARSGNRISSGKEQRAETIQLIATNALPAGEKILAYSAKLEQPMKSEIDALLFDTKTAVRSLAMQFLPESTMD